MRAKARALAPDLYEAWREAGAVAAVRVNPLDGDGMDDLAAVMRGRPDIIGLPKVAEPAQVAALADAVARFERAYGIAEGATRLLRNIVAVDCPYTWSDAEGVERDTRWARRLGYVAKSAVQPAHAAAIKAVLTPSEEELHRAGQVVEMFEAARARGEARIEMEGSLVEVPTYLTAKRLLARGAALRRFA